MDLDMISEFDFSEEDSLKVKVLAVEGLKLKLGNRVSEESIYFFCRITPEEYKAVKDL